MEQQMFMQHYATNCRCRGYTIHLALDDPGFKPLMKKAKKLVKTFKHSPLAAQLLQDNQIVLQQKL